MTLGGNAASDRVPWLKLTVLLWVLLSAALILWRWAQIHWFALGDTDDNLRLMQVRALLNGQDWYDLRQYRLSPPEGIDIHWSRWVDLPLAGIILLLRPFIGSNAEYVAITLAPLIPLAVAMTGLAVATRRLVGRWAFVIAIAVLLFCQGLLSMYMPTRIDHHGWQLALLPWLAAGLADPDARRGGLTVGAASALSLVIGMEMAPYLALAGGVIVLRWVFDGSDTQRLRGYAVALGIGTALGFLLFASNANRLPRCDALTPVWLFAALAGSVMLIGLSTMKRQDWQARLGVAVIAGGGLAALHVLLWPQCLGNLEGMSPELKRMWFDNIREVKPITKQAVDVQIAYGFSALIGIVGAAFALIRARGSALFWPWLGVTLFSLCAGAMILWQSRAGAATQMFSIPGATALGYVILPKLRAHHSLLVRVLGTFVAFALISGIAVQTALMMKPQDQSSNGAKKSVSTQANASCATIPSLAPVGRLPRGTVFTFVDLAPRLIVLTHHNAITGPYHRNGQAILDVQKAFRGSAEAAEPIVRKYGSRYVMICTNSSESTIYKADNAKGFYGLLAKGQVPGWLKPVTLPASSPYRMWEVLPASTPDKGEKRRG